MGAFGIDLIRHFGGDLDTYDGNKKPPNTNCKKQFKVIIAGSRNPKLSGKILISEKDKEGKILTHWDKIYN